jgi:lipopolysaccharide/colanic/teichoic acid biosynthesis glycosyltransferase
MFVRPDSHADSRSLQDTPLEIPDLANLQESFRGWRADRPHRPAFVPVRTPGTFYEVVKPTLDAALALVLLVLTAPVVLLVMALVRLTSPGPALYSQVRLGKGGRPFRIWKIRTMQHNCEGRTGARWSVPGDPRVTPLGRFLRASHLDELPQLWNILRGDMSLIGPRPERPEIVARLEKAIPQYRNRLAVRPGVTGLAQVQLPPDADVDDVRRKVAADLAYIGHLVWWLDLRIAALTALHLFGIPCHRLCRLLLPAAGRVPAESRVVLAGGPHR